MALVEKLYIYVIDGSEGFWSNPVDWLDSALTIGDITVISVPDMVRKVTDRLGPGRKIQNLFIGGHGSPGYQSVGAGTSHDSSGMRSLQCDPADPTKLRGVADTSMRALASRFTSDAIITLGGCRTGADNRVLTAVSNAVGGLRVQAGTANQRPFVPGMEGTVVRCRRASCSNMSGRSWWSSPGSWIQ